MAVREVLRLPHPALKSVCAELGAEEGDRARAVSTDLLDTMRANAGCVGLAAPQLGELVRVVVIDVSEHPKATTSHGEVALINPVVERATGDEVAREGCLSIPELTANVRRATQVVVSARTPAGASVRIETEGFEARCLMHELDHLDGIVFLDRVDSLATDVFRRKQYR
jgi:peptide deformylase